MFTTPQLIKDKEFVSKFRGFDPIEVKEYLETLADEFFELQEKCKEQEDALASTREAKESSDEYSSSLETDIEFTRKISEELKEGCAQKEEKLEELTAEVEELQLRIADMEQENVDHDEELSAVEAGRREVEEVLNEVKTEADILTSKIEVLREQNSDLKKEEIDFKATLATAQRFAEDLKAKSTQEAEDLKAKSMQVAKNLKAKSTREAENLKAKSTQVAEKLKTKSTREAEDLKAKITLETEEMIQDAEDEISQIREDAQAELERLPKEIEILENKKYKVKAELKAILTNYLETIDVFYPDDLRVVEKNENLSGQEENLLFQKIEINDNGSMTPEDAAKLTASEEGHMIAREQDEKVIDSLLRRDSKNTDELNLKDMFNLETEVD